MAAGYSVIDRDGRREEVMKMVIDGVPFAKIAHKFGYSKDTVAKYVKEHLLKDVALASNRKRSKLSSDFMSTMGMLQNKLEKLMDACEEWLRKPHSSKYTLDPRADEISVIYTHTIIDEESGEILSVAKEEAPLSELIEMIETHGYVPSKIRWKQQDPRKLMIDTLSEARAQAELIARVTGDLKEIATTADIFGTVVPCIVSAIKEATRDYPELGERIADAIEGNLAIAEDGGFRLDAAAGYRK